MSENFESTAVGFKQSLTGNAFGREWGKLPNDIAKNPDVRDLALVLLAFRTTFAGKWILKWRKVQKACSKGLGERAFWAALAILIRLGLITRVKIPIPGKQGRGKVIDDPLTLPTFGENYRRVERAWFDGTMTMKALALLFFIRAWGLVGVHPWQVRKRFGWSFPTIKKTADELISAGLIANLGAKQAPRYVEENSKNAQSKKPQCKKLKSKKTQSLRSVTSLHNVSPLHTVESLQRETAKPNEHGTDFDASNRATTKSPDLRIEGAEQQRWGGNRLAVPNSATSMVVASAEITGGLRTRGSRPLDPPGKRQLSEDAKTSIRRLGKDPDEYLDRSLNVNDNHIAKGKPGISWLDSYAVASARRDVEKETGADRDTVQSLMTGNQFARDRAARIVLSGGAKAPLPTDKERSRVELRLRRANLDPAKVFNEWSAANGEVEYGAFADRQIAHVRFSGQPRASLATPNGKTLLSALAKKAR